LKLSQIPDNVKRVLLATCSEDIDVDEIERLSTDELLFCYFYACPEGSITAWLMLRGRPGFNGRQVDMAGNPWGDERLELDEPLPALTRPASLARPDLADCAGDREANRRLCLKPEQIGDYFDADHYRAEILGARYADLYERELHFGWPVPEYEEWAKTQAVPGLD
jgi:hypothetical protein